MKGDIYLKHDLPVVPYFSDVGSVLVKAHCADQQDFAVVHETREWTENCERKLLFCTLTGFIFVQFLRGFSGQSPILDICFFHWTFAFYPCLAPNITGCHKYLPFPSRTCLPVAKFGLIGFIHFFL